MVNQRLRTLLAEPLKCLHEDLFLLPIHDVPPNLDHDHDRSSVPASVISVMSLPCDAQSTTNVQQMKSQTLEDCSHDNWSGITMQSAQPRRGRGSTACSLGLAQVLTLPLPSSDSEGGMQSLCDAPTSSDQNVSDNRTIVECVSPTNDGLDELPLPRNTTEGKDKEHNAIPVSETFTQFPANRTPTDDNDVERDEPRKYVSLPEQGHQSDYVKEIHGNNPPRLGMEREHFGSSHLLSHFMAMMGATQRTKLHAAQRSTYPMSCTATSTTASLTGSKSREAESNSVSHTGEHLNTQAEACRKQILPAVSPEISSPSQSGCCLVSIQLGHSVIRHLEELWPANHLIDRDFCSHIGTGNEHFHGGSITMQSTTFQASEVDVSLTVEDGIIVTTLLQISQKPLPGSKALTAIRQRVYHLSQKYPRLTIFVLESPGPEDSMSDLSPGDVDIYAGFVCFASSFKAKIAVHLVPGGDKTLSRWILSLMIRFAPQFIELDKTTTMGNTTWELFFRQTGMNVRAAHVLSHSLFEDFGTFGLTAFLNMTTANQILEYGRRLGIEPQVAQCAVILGILNQTT
ncbi:hypothetical protein E4U42_004209 [Claviceps africana]|uniref:Uncharacterized protein n=1 Tax=Claviceps africana TaxID=83212 RepID=A0A8K0J667_9HYPO|nr:hypothetical protein E4U42_004209 [Claviceps africana]